MITNTFLGTIINTDRIGDIELCGEIFSPADRAALEWQYRPLGDFKRALWDAIMVADGVNLNKLASGFPDEVGGFMRWTQGDLKERTVRAADEWAENGVTEEERHAFG